MAAEVPKGMMPVNGRPFLEYVLEMLAGHGIAVITPRFEAQSFASGRLVPLFDITASSGDGYYLAYPRDQRTSRKIRLFRDWVLKEAAAG